MQVDIGFVMKIICANNNFSGLPHETYSFNYIIVFYDFYDDSVIRYGLLVHGSLAETNIKKNR